MSPAPGSRAFAIAPGRRLTMLLGELLAFAESTVAFLPPDEPVVDDLIVCPEFVADGEVIRTIGMAARFDSALDVTLEELRIELLYPADAVAEAFFRRCVRGSR